MALNNPAPIIYQNIREKMDARNPKKDTSAVKGLLGPSKQKAQSMEYADIKNPANRVMEYMDIIMKQREELKSND